jgi:putative membrane-bound dehydrogenase-like protein
VAACSSTERPAGPPYDPKAAIDLMEIEPGFRVELVASEPDIASPVAMEIDENGHLFVVEMPGYPLDMRPTGRVKLLHDTNGDGRIDRSTVFADQLVLPAGVMRWKKGILVTAAPDVIYFEDTNGDGRADIRRVVVTGFALSNPQHNLNAPTYGLDNWVYFAYSGGGGALFFNDRFGDRGKPIRFPERPDVAPVDVGRRAVRIDLDEFRIEALSSQTQFGHTWDAWGRYFTTNNSQHVRHEVIAARYLQRNSDLLLASAMQPAWNPADDEKLYPITEKPRIELLTEYGQYTSACGLTRYLGGAFPAGYEQISFVAEPVHNLIHVDRWEPKGATFSARRVHATKEFLASRDSWFRPVNFYIGPDGALYVIDYYRPMLEHPEWTSSEYHKDSPDLYVGSDKGRIYRIVAPRQARGAGGFSARPRLGSATDDELVKALGHANVWWRRTAQRLLVDRRSEASVPLLQRAARERPSALARLHALWALEGLGRLDAALIEQALDDPEPGVRDNAIRLAELSWRRPTNEGVATRKLLAMGSDPDPRVRFQLLTTLGFIDDPAARGVEQQLLERDLEDEWVHVAALSSSSDRAVAQFDRAARGGSPMRTSETPGRASFFNRVASVIGARQRPDEIARVVRTASVGDASHGQAGVGPRPGNWWRAASLQGLAAGVQARRPSTTAATASAQPPKLKLPEASRLLLTLADDRAAAIRRAALTLLGAIGLPEGAPRDAAVTRAATIAADRSSDAERRADAIALLALTGSDPHVELLQRLVALREPEAVQAAAITALGQSQNDGVAAFLLSRWRAVPPAVRSKAADALVRRPARAKQLVDAMKSGGVQAWTLNFSQRRALLMNRDEAVRTAARVLLEEKPHERNAVLQRYEAAIDAPADAARGEQVFKATCAKCHKFNGVGATVGPDLGTVRNRPSSVLLVDILQPSRAIAGGYEAYVVERISGGIEDGVLASQTPTTVVLKKEDKEIVVPRDDIRQMYAANLSAMPADLEKQISPDQMADLLRYLRGSK